MKTLREIAGGVLRRHVTGPLKRWVRRKLGARRRPERCRHCGQSVYACFCCIYD